MKNEQHYAKGGGVAKEQDPEGMFMRNHYKKGGKFAKGTNVESKKSWLDGIEYLFNF